ncbi:MAG TPA: hypothetical protein VHD90_21145, partial [Phototrophicaceae bacterium]|nr:hypothetical protein [Phototrophicaceae bacterium]
LYPSFGSQSLRISNSYADGNFGNQPHSPSLTDAAGETAEPFFTAQWDFASATGASQPGLLVTASPDQGTSGNRMYYVGMEDDGSGNGSMAVTIFDFNICPTGNIGNDFDPCYTDGANGSGSLIASGLDPSKPHTIRLTMNFVAGPNTSTPAIGSENDIVCVYVDNILKHQGTSWENYYRARNVDPASYPVDSMMFRPKQVSGSASVGEGFLLDNFSMSSGPVPAGADTGCPSLTTPSSPGTSHAATAQPIPTCALVDGGTDSIVRADAPPNVFCRILNQNGSYVRNAAEVGDVNLITQGVKQAVDVFSFGDSGEQLTTFSAPIKVCLEGTGQFFYRDANGQPRTTALLPSMQEGGYTCAYIPDPGTVILV